MMLFNIKRGIHYIYDQRKGSICSHISKPSPKIHVPYFMDFDSEFLIRNCTHLHIGIVMGFINKCGYKI